MQSKTAGTEIFLIQRLGSNFTRESHRRYSIKKVFLKISQYSQENTCARVPFLFKLQTFIKKETVAQGFSREFFKIFKNTFFPEHLWMTVSVLKQLLALYFAIYIAANFQAAKSHSSGKKFIHISQGFYRFLLHIYFFHFLRQMPVYLVGYLVFRAANRLLARGYLNTTLLTLSTKI